MLLIISPNLWKKTKFKLNKIVFICNKLSSLTARIVKRVRSKFGQLKFLKVFFFHKFRSQFDLFSFLIFVGEIKKCLARPSLSSGEFEELRKEKKEKKCENLKKTNAKTFWTNKKICIYLQKRFEIEFNDR